MPIAKKPMGWTMPEAGVIATRPATAPAAAAATPNPAEPQQGGADNDHRDVVRLHRLAAEAVALAVEDRRGEGGNAGVDVNDGATGEVERLDADLTVGVGHEAEPAALAPYPVGDRVVD